MTTTTTYSTSHNSLLAACKVVALAPHIRQWIQANDPMAYRQVLDAIAEADAPPLTRFDIPAPVRTVLDSALALRIIDGADLFAMSLEYNGDWRAVMEQIGYAAFGDRHNDAGRARHKTICELIDAANAALAIA